LVVPPVADLTPGVATHRPRVAIVGCGNPNRSDDGAGISVVRRLKGRGVDGPASNVHVFDAGTDGMAVMFAARGCRTLIVVDACQSGADPGAIFEVPGAALEQLHRPSLTLHDFRWDNAIAAGRKIFGAAFPDDVLVFLIEARSLELGLELSAEVEAAAATVAVRIQDLLRERATTAAVS
jgi:hydrogenase maturation protease